MSLLTPGPRFRAGEWVSSILTLSMTELLESCWINQVYDPVLPEVARGTCLLITCAKLGHVVAYFSTFLLRYRHITGTSNL